MATLTLLYRAAIFMLLISAGQLSAEAKTPKPTITFITESWEGYTNTDGTGVYLELIKKVFEPDHNVVIKYVPWKRAMTTFAKGDIDGIIGASSNHRNLGIRTEIPIDYAYFTAFFLKSN